MRYLLLFVVLVLFVIAMQIYVHDKWVKRQSSNHKSPKTKS